MTAMLTGCARCPTDTRDLDTNRRIPLGRGVPADRIHPDRVFSGVTRARPGLDQAPAALHDPAGEMVFHTPATLVEFGADPMRRLSRDGVAVAKAGSRLKGRAPKPSTARQANPRELHAVGGHPTAEVAELCEVHRQTVYRDLGRATEGAP